MHSIGALRGPALVLFNGTSKEHPSNRAGARQLSG